MFKDVWQFFSNAEFMPHGHCYLWKPPLVLTMVITDSLIGLAYVSISASLYWLVKKIRLPFSAMFIAFGIFILACGATHFMEIYTLWVPNYWLAAFVKFITAIASVITAIYMFPIAPKIMGLAKAVEVSEARGQELQRAYQEMERRVRERTLDLTQMNQALRASEERLEKALVSRDDFLSIASHELKTPLSSLKLQMELVAATIPNTKSREALVEKMEKMVQTSERQVNRMTALVEDLLDVSRIQAGKLALNFEEMDLGDVARDVMERLSPQLSAAHCQLDFACKAPVIGQWDRSRIDQIFVNLLMNALKYASGSPLQVEVKTDSSGDAIISVKDSGPGIPADKINSIFERFQRASASRNIGGLGLGLYITKNIIEAHKGSISVSSEVGKGATFLVRLPRSK